MEGKVELTIDRYEELTYIERNHKKELDEISKHIEGGEVLLVDSNRVLGVEIQYLGKDEFIKKLEDGYKEQIKTVKQQLVQAQCDKSEVINAIEKATFFERFSYLFTGNFKVEA